MVGFNLFFVCFEVVTLSDVLFTLRAIEIMCYVTAAVLSLFHSPNLEKASQFTFDVHPMRASERRILRGYLHFVMKDVTQSDIDSQSKC